MLITHFIGRVFFGSISVSNHELVSLSLAPYFFPPSEERERKKNRCSRSVTKKSDFQEKLLGEITSMSLVNNFLLCLFFRKLMKYQPLIWLTYFFWHCSRAAGLREKEQQEMKPCRRLLSFLCCLHNTMPMYTSTNRFCSEDFFKLQDKGFCFFLAGWKLQNKLLSWELGLPPYLIWTKYFFSSSFW